jgi:hypothetical protein
MLAHPLLSYEKIIKLNYPNSNEGDKMNTSVKTEFRTSPVMDICE